ncbi:hypothetical protein GO011_11680 [Mycobacterium sp. 20091114027_K0903767]|nr:hypothetical protein [Mycobacterium sp. 20091114027_K0903767]
MTAHNAAAEALRARIRREEAALHAAGYLTVADAVQLLSVARNTVNRMIGDGRLRVERVDDRILTRREWIDEAPCSRKAATAWRREHGFLSVAEAAAQAGITRQAMQVRISRRRQKAVRAGADAPVPGAWLIREEDVVGRQVA